MNVPVAAWLKIQGGLQQLLTWTCEGQFPLASENGKRKGEKGKKKERRRKPSKPCQVITKLLKVKHQPQEKFFSVSMKIPKSKTIYN